MARVGSALLLTAGLSVAVAGCGASNSHETTCLRSHGARVCAASIRGSVTISADGLEPGSNLTLETAASGADSYKIGDSGTPDGAIGFIAYDVSKPPPTITVTASAANGAPLTGELSLPSSASASPGRGTARTRRAQRSAPTSPISPAWPLAAA